MKSFFVEKLRSLFPELENEINGLLEEYPEVYLHLIFGDVFNPYLLGLLKDPQDNQTNLLKAGELLEDMACSDTEIQEVLVTTILERLSDHPEQLSTFRPFAGQHTIQFIVETAEFFC